MGKVMVSLVAPTRAPTLIEIEQRYQLPTGSVDRQFGVVEVDDTAHEYTILVEQSAAPLIHSTAEWKVGGVFANPRIEAFGTPRAEDDGA